MALYDFLIQAPQGEHIVHFFDSEKEMLQTVAIFVSLGITQGDGVLLITSKSRLNSFKVFQRGSEQIIVLDTAELLSRFFIKGKLNEQDFKEKVTETIQQMRKKFKRVRVWGGMVNSLLDDGLKEAALECEEVWNKILLEVSFFLFHTYVLSPDLDQTSIEKLCSKHSYSANGQRLKIRA
jgi:hypothetical protein